MWFHLYPLGFVGAPASAPADTQPVHRLGRVLRWLDYIAELGATVVQLGPIFASETHGYDTVDYFRIDPRLGDDDDFDALVAACRERGLRLVLDGVFNHVGRSFPDLAALASDRVFEGHDALVVLDHTKAEVAALVTDVARHWLDRGASGWRLDAAYAMPRPFLRGLIHEVRATHPTAFFLAEVIHGDYAGFVADTDVDTVTQYELWKALWSSIADANFFELTYALDRHAMLLDTFMPLTFVGNHDVTRIASQIGEARHVEHAIVALLTIPGVPSVYAGDEQGLEGVKRDEAGGDDAVRPEFPDLPTKLVPGGWDRYGLHRHLIGLRHTLGLGQGRLSLVTRTNRTLVYDVTGSRGMARVGLNLEDGPLRVEASGNTAVIAAGFGEIVDGLVVVPGHRWVVLTG